MIFHLDKETRSASDLKKVGGYRYGSDVSTDITLTAISENGVDPILWDRFFPLTEESREARNQIQKAATTPEAILWAHNSSFEAAVAKYKWAETFGTPAPALTQWRCTAAMSRRMAIPSSLAGAAEFLGVAQQKDKRGGMLINIFSVPQKKGFAAGRFIHPVDDAAEKVTVAGEKITVAEAWTLFGEYCRQDVRTEMEIHKKLKGAEFTGDILDGFLFDIVLNDRGIPVDVESLRKAQALIENYSDVLTGEFMLLTNGLVPSQRGAALSWLQERGYRGEDLRASTMEDAIDEEEDDEQGGSWSPHAAPEARRALQIRQWLSYAAVKKVKAMLDCACPDNRVRGAVMFWGAMRTGRSSGRLIQPQNFKRPTVDSHERAFWDIANGYDHEDISLMHGPPMEVLASCMRHFIREPGREFFDSDFAQIEARVLAWIAGHNVLLEAFRRGDDLYRFTYVSTFGGKYEDVTKDQRFWGKIISLFLGYQGGENAFVAGAKVYGMEVEGKKARSIVKAYRENNPEMPQLWRAMQSAAVKAINSPGQSFEIETCAISFKVVNFAGYQNLLMTLPSGRKLVYPKPMVERKIKKFTNKDTGEVRDWEVNEISYWGERMNKWGRVITHSGVLTENAAQAIAGDFLTLAAVRLDKAGYDINLPIHDQLLALTKDGQSAEEFNRIMCELPSWAKGFPLAAETSTKAFYTKD